MFYIWILENKINIVEIIIMGSCNGNPIKIIFSEEPHAFMYMSRIDNQGSSIKSIINFKSFNCYYCHIYFDFVMANCFSSFRQNLTYSFLTSSKQRDKILNFKNPKRWNSIKIRNNRCIDGF